VPSTSSTVHNSQAHNSQAHSIPTHNAGAHNRPNTNFHTGNHNRHTLLSCGLGGATLARCELGPGASMVLAAAPVRA
jgi:hypothetical protein